MKKYTLIRLDLFRVKNAEFKQFITRFFEDFQGTELSLDTDEVFKSLFESLKRKSDTYAKALEQVRAKEESKKISELNKIRNADFQALKDSIKPYKNAKTEDQQKAYHALKLVFDSYKGVVKDSYEGRTSRLHTLVNQLRSNEYNDDVVALYITNFVNELDKSNTAFNEIFNKRSLQSLQKNNLNVKEIRKEISEIYQNMANYIVAVTNVKEDPFYTKTLEVLNNSRKYYADILACR